jgi:hypothetical protein
MAGIILTVVLLAIYVLFLLWYYGSRKPLSREEAERYISIMEKRAGGSDKATESIHAAFRKFALEDDGKQFFMCNLVKYQEKAQYADGDRGLTSKEANLRYARNTMPLLLIRACHPYGLFRPVINLRQADNYWDEVNIVRYRSRRDVLSLITSEKWYEGYADKAAALSDNPNMPSKAFVVFPIIPVVVFTILLLIWSITVGCLYFKP